MARSLRSRAPAPPGAQSGGIPAAPLGGTRNEAFRRLQMGGIGVVAVLLLIGLASIIKDRATQTESTSVAGAAASASPTPSAPAGDPLAEAGVVPVISATPSPSRPPAPAMAEPAAAPTDAR